LQRCERREEKSRPNRDADQLTEEAMRTLVLSILLTVTLLFNVGCILPIYSSSSDIRARELIYTSESLRHIPEIWERVWMIDAPDFETPYRTHGGVI